MIGALRGPHRDAVPKMPWSGLLQNFRSSSLMRWALRVAALDQHHVGRHICPSLALTTDKLIHVVVGLVWNRQLEGALGLRKIRHRKHPRRPARTDLSGPDIVKASVAIDGKVELHGQNPRLTYPERGSCTIQEPSSGTAFMPGDVQGRIVSHSVVMDRGGVRSPSSSLMT